MTNRMRLTLREFTPDPPRPSWVPLSQVPLEFVRRLVALESAAALAMVQSLMQPAWQVVARRP